MALLAQDDPFVPTPATSLIGREQTTDALRQLMLRHDVRLITLTGPGGVGKTRIALHLLDTLRSDTEIEPCLVLLSNATNDQMALAAIARALGLPQASLAPMEDVIAHAIGRRHMVLVLDNVEQLADSLTMIPAWLARCPHLTILTTSRVMLRLSAEHVFPIEPLPTVGKAQVLSPAANLFVERAMAVQPHLDRSPESMTAINDICQRLDGLPLAIELAAARTRFLSPVVLRERLSTRLQALIGGPRDAPERHRTLRATIAWSHDLLDPDELRMFERIAFFEGGGPLEAVLAVGNAANDLTREPEDVLSSLVDHSLVRMIDAEGGTTRVRMLQTIREFALEQLCSRPDLTLVERAHAEWFANEVISQPDVTWRTGSPEMQRWSFRRLPEFNNFRLAMTTLLQQQEYVRGLHLAGALMPFLAEIGQTTAAAEWAVPLLPHIDEAPNDVKVLASRMAAVLAMMEGKLDDAAIWSKRAFEVSLEIGHVRLIANNENLHGQILWRLGDPVTAERYQRSAIERVRQDGDPLGGALFGFQIAEGLIEQGDLDRAEEVLQEGLPVVKRFRPELAPLIEGALAQIAMERNDLDLAGQHLEAALTFHLKPPHRQPLLLASRLGEVAELAARRGRQEPAAWLAGACVALLARVGMVNTKVDTLRMEALFACILAPNPTFDLQSGMAHGETLLNDLPALLELATSITRLRAQPPAASEPAPPASELDSPITRREHEVLMLLDEGLSNTAIAERLFISQRTVTTHLSRLYAKLEVSSRTEALATARRMGLLYGSSNPST